MGHFPFHSSGGGPSIGLPSIPGLSLLSGLLSGSTLGGIAGTVGRGGRGGQPSAPLLQGSAQIRRIRQAGSSLEPGEGQGFLGSIQAGANPNAFDELLFTLLSPNRNGLTGR